MPKAVQKGVGKEQVASVIAESEQQDIDFEEEVFEDLESLNDD